MSNIDWSTVHVTVKPQGKQEYEHLCTTTPKMAMIGMLSKMSPDMREQTIGMLQQTHDYLKTNGA